MQTQERSNDTVQDYNAQTQAVQRTQRPLKSFTCSGVQQTGEGDQAHGGIEHGEIAAEGGDREVGYSHKDTQAKDVEGPALEPLGTYHMHVHYTPLQPMSQLPTDTAVSAIGGPLVHLRTIGRTVCAGITQHVSAKHQRLEGRDEADKTVCRACNHLNINIKYGYKYRSGQHECRFQNDIE